MKCVKFNPKIHKPRLTLFPFETFKASSKDLLDNIFIKFTKKKNCL